LGGLAEVKRAVRGVLKAVGMALQGLEAMAVAMYPVNTTAALQAVVPPCSTCMLLEPHASLTFWPSAQQATSPMLPTVPIHLHKLSRLLQEALAQA